MYGADGRSITSLPAAYPGYAQVSLTGATVWSNGASSDPAAPQTGTGSGVMACWYGATQFSFDITLTDSATHRVALYVVDWFNGGRVETITVADAATGAVLDARTVSAFTAGQYLVWNISGHVTVTVTRNSGANSVVSGLFFQ